MCFFGANGGCSPGLYVLQSEIGSVLGSWVEAGQRVRVDICDHGLMKLQKLGHIHQTRKPKSQQHSHEHVRTQGEAAKTADQKTSLSCCIFSPEPATVIWSATSEASESSDSWDSLSLREAHWWFGCTRNWFTSHRQTVRCFSYLPPETGVK